MMYKVQLFILLAILSYLTSLPLLAGEESLYDFNWLDPDKKVYVLQNKIYEKKNTFYLNIGYGYATSSDFQSANNIQLKAGYFFAEEWGIELIYSSISNSANDTLENISSDSSAVPFIRRHDGYYGAMAVFSPFYAKINTFNKIFYFDLNFGLGLMSITGESNRQSFLDKDATLPFTSESYMGVSYKIEARAYITRNWNINLTLLNTTFKADSAVTVGKKIWASNQDLIFAIGYSL